MKTEVRWRFQADGPRNRRAVTVLCAAFLTFYIITVHAQHVLTPDPGLDSQFLQPHAAQRPGDYGPDVQAGMGMGGMDCPLPSMLTPRVDGMPAVVSIPAWWLPVLAIAAVQPRSEPIEAPLPRPPGPTRQALLQRFLL